MTILRKKVAILRGTPVILDQDFPQKIHIIEAKTMSQLDKELAILNQDR